jgi:plasmid stability protein
MSITIELSEETEQRLQLRAAELGLSLDEYVKKLLTQEISAAKPPETAEPRKPLGGRLAHLNLQTPTLEEFQEARREMWATSPREFSARW